MVARRMDRVWIGSGAAAAVVIAAAGWLFFVSPQWDAKAASEQQLVDAQTQNVVLQQKISRLQVQSEHAGELQDELDGVRAGVPTRHDMDSFTRQIGDQAGAAGITVESISPGQPTPIIQRSPATAAPQPDAAQTQPDSTSTASPDAAATAPAPPDQAAQIYSIAVTVVTAGPMDGQREFLSLLEKQGPRRALVVSTTFATLGSAAGASGTGAVAAPTTGPLAGSAATDAAVDQWTMTTQLQVFVAPQAPASDSAAPATPEPASNG